MHKSSLRNRHGHHHDDFDLHGDIEKIKEALAETTQDMKGKAAEMLFQSIEDARERSAAVKDNVTNYVTEKPLKSLGIAMLAGMLIGYLIHK
jgi:ElaB/YqjD/DUF883 family membrane-anchored ribosome-binding protein